jgi:hypothetical protein
VRPWKGNSDGGKGAAPAPAPLPPANRNSLQPSESEQFGQLTGDGLPDAWEKVHGLDPQDPADAAKLLPAGKSQDDRHRGYPYIEFYLNELADSLVP